MRKAVHRYGDDPSQFGVLYGEGPVAVVIHCGFWKAEYGLDLNEALAGTWPRGRPHASTRACR